MGPVSQPDPFLTIVGAVRLLHELGTPMGEMNLRRLATAGALPCERTASGVRLFRPADLVAFAEARAQRRRPARG